jgi:geranylgeranyl diphosphate synthase, type II
VDFHQQLQVFRESVESGLRQWVPLDTSTPERLAAAMRHSLDAGGKRIRPVLLLASYGLRPGEVDPLPAAVAVECLHTYSLIHDDLPSMDDSALRRGLPTCHVAFDEATAVLAGDALLTLAFELLAKFYEARPALANALVLELASAAGSGRLIGGQMEDIQLERHPGGPVPLERIERIEDNKTGALFCASLRMGLLLSGADGDQLATATRLGGVIGRSFQIVDDILDAVGDEQVVGKSLHTDERNLKTTAVTHYGLDGARRQVEHLYLEGLQLCRALAGDSQFLQSLLYHLKNRAS